MLSEMFIDEKENEDRTNGVVSLNVIFSDDPTRVHAGQLPFICTRHEVASMLRELATHIEYDIATNDDKH